MVIDSLVLEVGSGGETRGFGEGEGKDYCGIGETNPLTIPDKQGEREV